MPRDWSRLEVEATVADYFDMFSAELRGEPYNKAEHRRELQRLLNDRSEGAIERKHQNISAVLIDLGFPFISGYKPLFNYQQLLYDVVADRLAGERELKQLVEHEVEREAEVPDIDDILAALEAPPKPKKRSRGYSREGHGGRRGHRSPKNYLAIEARNSSLGTAGERFTLNYERARLIHARKESLADRVEHVAVTLGDWEGFDIRSFEADGSDRLIEVKTTSYGKETPFYITRNELETSRERGRFYHLYRVFEFRRNPRVFTLKGSLDRTCDLDAIQFVGRTK